MSRTTNRMGGVTPLILQLLQKDPSLSDNDRGLVIAFWKEILEKKYEVPIGTVTLEQFFNVYSDKEYIPSSEVITRAKRKILEEYPELRGKTYKGRQDESDDTRRDINNM